jgi:hypothetical protein
MLRMMADIFSHKVSDIILVVGYEVVEDRKFDGIKNYEK